MESASEQPAERLGSSTVLAGFSTLADSAMKWTPQKTMVDCGHLLGLDGELQRVAHHVGQPLDLGQLVVVGQDDRVLLPLQLADLGLDLAHLLGGEVGAGDGVRDRVVDGDDGQAHGRGIDTRCASPSPLPSAPSPAALAAAREAARPARPPLPAPGHPVARRGGRRRPGRTPSSSWAAHASLWVDGAEQRWHPGMGGAAGQAARPAGSGSPATPSSRRRGSAPATRCSTARWVWGPTRWWPPPRWGPAAGWWGSRARPALAAWAGEGFARLPGEAASRVEVIAADHAAWLDGRARAQLRRGGLRPHVPPRPRRGARVRPAAAARPTPAPSPARRSTGRGGWPAAACS